jgi:hypothetical protein
MVEVPRMALALGPCGGLVLYVPCEEKTIACGPAGDDKR